MKLLDLFSGIGGFSLAFKRVFPEGEIIGFSEIDKYAIQIYQKHFPGVKSYGSVTDIRAEDLPKFNIVSFGFPCQDLSIAGKRKGFTGQRSSLFHEAIRIIDKCRPEYFVFENVAGLFSSHQGKDFITVLQAITDIGYSGQWQLINTKWFLPQNRERIYFIGHLGGIPRPEIFPIGESNGLFAESGGERETESQICTAITSNYRKDVHSGWETYIKQVNHPKHSNDRVYDPEGISPTLNTMQGGNRQPFIMAHYGHLDKQPTIHENCPTLKAQSHGHEPCAVQNADRIAGWSENDNRILAFRDDEKRSTCQEHVYYKEQAEFINTLNTSHVPNLIQNNIAIPVLTPDRPEKRQNGRRFKEDGEPAFTLTAQDKHGIFNGSTIRRLTPTECERLQGFPDSWTKYGIDTKGGKVEISDSQRYKCLGNAISVPVPEEIFRRLKRGNIETD